MVCLILDRRCPKEAVPDSEKAVGIDVGYPTLRSYPMAFSIENQRYLAACEEQLSNAQSKKDKLHTNRLNVRRQLRRSVISMKAWQSPRQFCSSTQSR